ncbi:hypothetical protein H206_05487 [Candidatus Electrothrix aarhusensis]|uniref:Uncharacterized protein n=1 Tax=Candidatus Electrothrix aarhusensis TaxID=1859131 RepID=A0A3S3R1J8_9BACT|nr:hypothetical protein H206_05487 [Candidatus Electrothrix aarhusensis]
MIGRTEAQRDGDIEHVPVQCCGKTKGRAGLPAIGPDDLRTLPVLFHALRVFVGVGQHRSVRSDHGDTGMSATSGLTAEVLEGIRGVHDKVQDFLLQQQGPGLDIHDHLIIIKRLKGRGGKPADRQNRTEADQQADREYLPEQGAAAHGSTP